jgi:hypothetical protein
MASVFDSLAIAATSAASLSTSSFFRLRAITPPLHLQLYPTIEIHKVEVVPYDNTPATTAELLSA